MIATPGQVTGQLATDRVAIFFEQHVHKTNTCIPKGRQERSHAMVIFSMKKLMVTVLAALNLLFGANLTVESVQAAEAKQAAPKRHKLPAPLATTQWGWLDPNESPKLTVDSGDIISVETMMHSHDKIQPGTTMEEIVALRKANPGGGPH